MADEVLRKPTLRDAEGIQKLILAYAERKLMLPRTLTQVYESLRDFHICIRGGRIIGCSALHLWSDLAEIRSLAVEEVSWRMGIGSLLVRACLDEAKALGVKTVFVLSYQPEFFEKLGFKRVNKDRFPHKIWVDCANCPQFPNCSEVALILEMP